MNYHIVSLPNIINKHIKKGEVCMKYNNFNREEYPVALSVKDVSQILGLSMAVTYQLVKSPGFPCIRVCKRLIVPRDKFFLWYDKKTEEPL